jgi:hypothetical protein
MNSEHHTMSVAIQDIRIRFDIGLIAADPFPSFARFTLSDLQ